MCDCIDKINEQLKESGYKLDLGIVSEYEKNTLNFRAAPLIACVKIGATGARRKDYKFISGKYCPFCGERLSKGSEGEAK